MLRLILRALDQSRRASQRAPFLSFSSQSLPDSAKPYEPFVPKSDAWVWTEPFSLSDTAGASALMSTAYKFLKNRSGLDLTISYVHSLFDKGLVRLWSADGRVKRVNRNKELVEGDRLLLPLSAVESFAARRAARERERRERITEAQAARVRDLILHEDDDILAIDKPAGLSCHRGRGELVGLDDIVARALSRGDMGVTPKLLHRLDRDVSGVVLFAKNGTAAHQLGDALREKSRAVVQGGSPESEGDEGAAEAKSDGEGAPAPFPRNARVSVRDMSPEEMLRPPAHTSPSSSSRALRLYQDPIRSIRKVYAAIVRQAAAEDCPSIYGRQGRALEPMRPDEPDLVLSLPTTNCFYFRQVSS